MVRGLNQVVKLAMVIVVERDEAKWLENHVGAAAHGFEHFGHALHIARLGFESHLDEVAFGERLRHLQKATGCRDGLQLGFGALAITER